MFYDLPIGQWYQPAFISFSFVLFFSVFFSLSSFFLPPVFTFVLSILSETHQLGLSHFAAIAILIVPGALVSW